MLTISDYKNWALNDQRSAVALDNVGNALMTERDRLGRVTRTFNRGRAPPCRASSFALTRYGGQVQNLWRRCSSYRSCAGTVQVIRTAHTEDGRASIGTAVLMQSSELIGRRG